MQTKTNLVRVNGIELGYQEFGNGKPLVLLHGGFGSVEMFGPNIEPSLRAIASSVWTFSPMAALRPRIDR